ncbi:MAG: hypothetical protein ACI8QC_004521 [Planctomycetota bacterium]|jgi:hypothetical protein
MDGSVERTTDRLLIPATPVKGKVGRQQQDESFQLDSEDAEEPKPEASPETEEEILPVGEATYDEAGKRLDVTA